MRILLGVGILSLVGAGLAPGEALQITTTPSHTATLTPTITPTPTITSTPTLTPTTGPTVIATPMPTPWPIGGAELQVNQVSISTQNSPDLATGADDGFIAVWTADDGSGAGVFGRRFSNTGVPISGDFQVNTATTGHQHTPSIASDVLGNFVVAWTSRPVEFLPSDVIGRRFAADGSPLGDDFVVNTYTTGYQGDPDVAMHPDGNFVVVWTSTPSGSDIGQDGDAGGIFGQQFDVAGDPVGDEFLVNSTTTGYQLGPAVATDGTRFLTVWSGESETGGFKVLGQMFQNDGSPIGSELTVSGPTGSSANPDVDGIWGAGQFVVVYEEYQGPGLRNVFGRLFRFDAEPLGDPFRVNTNTAQQHFLPRVSASKSGYQEKNFVVVWETPLDEPGQPTPGIYAQRFANYPFGTAAFSLVAPPRDGSEYQVNTYVTGDQMQAAVTSDERGQFVIAWASFGQDGDETGIFARRFGFPDAAAARIVDDAPGNENGVLDPGETVVFDTAWRNAGGVTGTIQGTLANLTGPNGPTYSIGDATAQYGDIPTGNTRDCLSQADCYELAVSGPRPAQHWDATADETLTSSAGPLLGAPLPRVKTWPLHVGGSFADVPDTDPFYAFVETIFHKRITGGGACGAGNFCGDDVVLRQQMAVFLLKGIFGADFAPPAATGTVFDDVPASNPFAPWIEELVRIGIVAGCAAPPQPALPSYCPTAPVNRQQMSVFLLKTRFGANFTPTECAALFEDVPCENPFAPYIEYLVDLQVTAGCQLSPALYCPANPTKREQMAAFLVKTFLLELYGPD